MARIRTVKPEFFRHEKLQELGPISMLVFQGLWTQCDKAGRFAWKPKTLKLDILPFLSFDMEVELQKLADALLIIRYEAQNEFFGVIPTFSEHQRISGKEAQEPAKYPDPPQAKTRKPKKLPINNEGSNGEASEKQAGSDGDGQESQEGKGREWNIGNGIGKGKESAPHPWFSNPEFLEAWNGWKEMRKKKDPLTERAEKLNFGKLQTHAGEDMKLAIAIVNETTEKSWSGFFPLKEAHGNRTDANRDRSGKHTREFPEKLTL